MSSSSQARWSGWLPSGERPSMVVISAPRTADTGSTHDRVATPFTCTVQAPHWEMPQPYLVPLRSRTSRSTHNSGMSGATSTVADFPLTVKVTGMGSVPPGGNAKPAEPYRTVPLAEYASGRRKTLVSLEVALTPETPNEPVYRDPAGPGAAGFGRGAIGGRSHQSGSQSLPDHRGLGPAPRGAGLGLHQRGGDRPGRAEHLGRRALQCQQLRRVRPRSDSQVRFRRDPGEKLRSRAAALPPRHLRGSRGERLGDRLRLYRHRPAAADPR